MSQDTSLDFLPVEGGSAECVAVLSLNRPEKANAFSKGMIKEVTAAAEQVGQTDECRTLILRGKGKHFCAGADIHWMKDSATLDHSSNMTDARELARMFESVANLPIPTMAVVQGAAYGGAVGLIAACDFAICDAKARLCLSEVNIGIIPAVIAPYLGRKMSRGRLRRFSLSGQIMNAQDALEAGLIDVVAKDGHLETAVLEEINQILSAAPTAQRSLKTLLADLELTGFRQSSITAESIAKVRTSEEGQQGLHSFLNKQPQAWVRTLAPEEYRKIDA